MCGLVGMVGNIDGPEKKMFRNMLIFDQIRGLDSTGVCAIPYLKVNGKTVPHLEKDLGAAQNLWDYNDSKIFDDKGIARLAVKGLIGHNRAATVGKVTRTAAHPFWYGDIIGAHNGTLRAWKDLHNADKVDVDSMALISNINKYGIDHTWKNFHGAAAITYWDNKTDEMNLIRNAERPLVAAESERSDVLFWASEAWMITVAAGSAKVKLKKDKEGKTILQSLKVDHHYRFSVNSAGFKLEAIKELEKKLYVVQKTSSHTQTSMNTFGPRKNSTSITHSTDPSGEIDLTKIQEFVNKGWKTNTISCSLEIKDHYLDNPRRIKRAGFAGVNKYEWVFRMAVMDHQGILQGTLDVCPQNKKEFKHMIQLEQDYMDGKPWLMGFSNKPRQRLNVGHTVCPWYVCTPSALYSERIYTREEVTEPGVSPTATFPSPGGGWVPLAEYKEHLKNCGGTCCYCDKTIEFKDSNVTWVGQQEILCGECNINWGGNLHLMMG